MEGGAESLFEYSSAARPIIRFAPIECWMHGNGGTGHLEFVLECRQLFELSTFGPTSGGPRRETPNKDLSKY